MGTDHRPAEMPPEVTASAVSLRRQPPATVRRLQSRRHSRIILSDRLQQLEEAITERPVLRETPVRVEYARSTTGRELATAIDTMTQWADTWREIESERAKR